MATEQKGPGASAVSGRVRPKFGVGGGEEKRASEAPSDSNRASISPKGLAGGEVAEQGRRKDALSEGARPRPVEAAAGCVEGDSLCVTGRDDGRTGSCRRERDNSVSAWTASSRNTSEKEREGTVGG